MILEVRFDSNCFKRYEIRFLFTEQTMRQISITIVSQIRGHFRDRWQWQTILFLKYLLQTDWFNSLGVYNSVPCTTKQNKQWSSVFNYHHFQRYLLDKTFDFLTYIHLIARTNYHFSCYVSDSFVEFLFPFTNFYFLCQVSSQLESSILIRWSFLSPNKMR